MTMSERYRVGAGALPDQSSWSHFISVFFIDIVIRFFLSCPRNWTRAKKDAVSSCRATRHREPNIPSGLRGSLNAATGTHEFRLGSVKEIFEAPVESS